MRLPLAALAAALLCAPIWAHAQQAPQGNPCTPREQALKNMAAKYGEVPAFTLSVDGIPGTVIIIVNPATGTSSALIQPDGTDNICALLFGGHDWAPASDDLKRGLHPGLGT